MAELDYLAREHCIITEHQRPSIEGVDDLVALSPAGHVHVSLLSNPTYIAACAEDTWVGEANLARDVAERIGKYGPRVHYSAEVTAANCRDLLVYLRAAAAKRYATAVEYCDSRYVNDSLSTLDEIIRDADNRILRIPNAVGWRIPDERFKVGCEVEGHIKDVKEYGLFIRLDDGPVGLAHVSCLPGRVVGKEHAIGRRVLVAIESIERNAGKARLRLIRLIQ
jgi:transcriptional accessory protein Tex/SPT6